MAAEAALSLGGRPASRHLRVAPDSTRVLVDHVLTATECDYPIGDEGRREITEVIGACMGLAADVLDSGRLPTDAELTRVRTAAGRWAHAGLPLAAVRHAFHAGFSAGLRMVADTAVDGERATLVDGAVLMFGLLDLVSECVATAYLDEYRTRARSRRDHGLPLATALLAGDDTVSAVADRVGARLAAGYQTVAVHFPPHPDEEGGACVREGAAMRKLARIDTALAEFAAPSASLAILTASGGTILLPDATATHVEILVRVLSDAGEVPVSAAASASSPERIPDAADNVYELLRLVQRLHYPPGVYRIEDLALEFQIARPGVGRTHLRRLLDPIRLIPDLLTTLEVFVATEANRKKAAKLLVVHPNTIDYRLKRIEQIIGVDPLKSSGLRALHAALIADSLGPRSLDE